MFVLCVTRLLFYVYGLVKVMYLPELIAAEMRKAGRSEKEIEEVVWERAGDIKLGFFVIWVLVAAPSAVATSSQLKMYKKYQEGLKALELEDIKSTGNL